MLLHLVVTFEKKVYKQPNFCYLNHLKHKLNLAISRLDAKF